MRLSVIGYFADFYLSIGLIAALAAWANSEPSAAGLLIFVLYAAAGFAVWTLLEYAVHRGLYHNVPYFEAVHDAHHAEPRAFIGAPPVIGPVLIFLLFFAPASAFSLFAACGVTSGVLAGYMAYMLVHHAAHNWTMTPGSWLYTAHRHHALHHHHHDLGNYGITTSFWDQVFGTALEARRRTQRYRLS